MESRLGSTGQFFNSTDNLSGSIHSLINARTESRSQTSNLKENKAPIQKRKELKIETGEIASKKHTQNNKPKLNLKINQRKKQKEDSNKMKEVNYQPNLSFLMNHLK
jgi:hypothetical protein